MDGDIYDQFGEAIDRRLGGVRAEAQRRAAAGPPPPAMFRLWQEKEEPPFGVEEVGSDEEVTQGLRGGSETEEAIIIESDDEEEEERTEPPSVLFEKMKDLLDKMGRYQEKLVGLCKEVKGWRSNIPTAFLYDSGPESAPGRPGVNVVGSCPQPGMRGRPLTPQARLAQAARTRNQAKASTGQEPPRGEHEPGRRKEVVEVEDDDDEEEEDERLRREDDQRAEQRARKKGIRGEAEPVIQDGLPKKKKYAVRLEEGFDVEKVIDWLLEGHNDLMTLKEILASAPRLRDELKGRLSRRLVPNVHLGTILPKEAEWAESGTKMNWKCIACGTVDLMVKGSKCAAMVDIGAEMNIIQEADAIRFGLDIDRSDCGILHRASCKAMFCWTASNVLVEVGKVKVRACFFIMSNVDHGILLGRSFLSRTETVMFNKHDGTLILLLCDPACENYEIITCQNNGPRSIRNRPNPGSCKIEESEGERRRLWAESEVGERVEAFSLSLSDVGKAMDLVAAHEMTDPDAIQALREQVLECPEAGRLEQVYRLPGSGGNPASVQTQSDSQRLNAVTVRDAGGLPNADALSESCVGKPIISLIDLYSGYDQFLVYPSDRPVTVMRTPRELVHMNVAQQGWTNAVAMVQRAMIRAMQSVSPHITQPYIDDLAVKGPATKESDEVSPWVRRFVWKHIQDLEKVMSLLEEHNLTASGAKSRHCMREATIFGIVCNEKGRRPDVKKTNKITEWPVPFHSITDVRSFLGTCGFWRVFVKNFAAKTGHLRKLVRQDQEWVWGEEQEEVVAKMKEEFREGGLVLGAPDYDATETRPFIVETDAGPTTLGGVLIQADMERKERPLRFDSRTLCTTERNYSQFKRETLAVLHCLRIFRNYIFGRRSDFTKTVMPRGGKGTRPPQRPLGASGGYERHGPRQRESTPVYNDGDIELFLDSFWEHARRMGWTVTQAIERLRGAGRFEEPIARIRREATRMEELRPSPVGPDGSPFRLEIENASDFIPAPLAMQIRDMARDWESCRAHLREAFRRPELPQPRVERRQRSQRPRDPEPREARPSRGGRKALARREQEPEDEERGAYPECGLGPVEFHRFTEGGLRRSPAHTQGEPPASEGPLRELEMHLDISRWRASLQGKGHGGAKKVPREEVPQEEVRGTQRERGLGDEGRRAGKEVIEVGEDTPSQTPAVGLRLGDALGSTRQANEGLQREETPLPSSEKAPSPEGRAERRRERAAVRREALILIDRHLAAHSLECPDLEEPAPAEPRQESCQPEKKMEAEIPKRFDLRTRERVPAGETAEEQTTRRTRRIDEIWQERQRLEAAGELPEQQQERQRSEAAGALPGQPPSAPSKAPEIPEMWRDFWEQRGEELPSPVRAGFGVARKAKERLDRKIKFLAKTTFDRHLLLDGDLAGKQMKEASHGIRLEAMEVEIQELRALVASQAAIIESLRQRTQGKVDRLESSRQGE
ncbi:hypothetical protein CBR_g31633 [Chara braunii]|uniref:Reverse transcriptase/retrotransposon-derived protein RNase H-like domain-containing protein n=1 Tax=Chara braunii TaxID=69332 RepID=A0A388LFI3_CHABU|nr:hypothetical protein CBR_g31633 [Chara braunii]|eukprot:GBG81075.1 hypothetical protein CBR_g31633 [Chara braunii]